MSKIISLAAAIASAGVLSGAVQAQPAGDASVEAQAQARAVEQCRRMSSAGLQIACLEAALETAYRTRNASNHQAAASPPAPAERREAGMLARLNPFGGAESDAQPSIGQPAQGRSASGLGAEQVNARERREAGQPGPLLAMGAPATITDAAIHGYASLVLALDNGQIWRQLSSDTQRLSADDVVGSTAVVREGAISGYRLELLSFGRTIRVERLR